MKQKIRSTLFLISLFMLLCGCNPKAVEPDRVGIPGVPALSPNPTIGPRWPAATPTFSSEPPPTAVWPISLDEIPEILPSYVFAREPVPANAEMALAWGERHGWVGLQMQEANDEVVRLLGSGSAVDDHAAGTQPELTFLRTDYEEVIIYSSGSGRPAPTGPTPLPGISAAASLENELVTMAALEFVRAHMLAPEPLLAHEFPYQDGYHIVHVAFAPAGFRQAGIAAVPGVTVRLDGYSRVLEARIISANFSRNDTLLLRPLAESYFAFLQGDLAQALYYERAQSSPGGPVDFLRYQAGSQPFGNQGDRIELVYAALPKQPEYLLPMWLVTRPIEASWDHYQEYYLLAAAGSEVPRPHPSPTPLAQMGLRPETLSIVPPLIIDEEEGLLFTNAAVDGITHTISLAAATGDLLAVFGLTGDLALDPDRDQLYVDKYPYGLTVIDTSTGAVQNEIQLPPGERGSAPPHADPATGNVLLFRDQMLLIADPLSSTWQQTVSFIVEGTVCGEPLTEPPAIDQTWFDPQARLLYLTLVDYVCTPRVSYTVIVYDLNIMSEIARYPGTSFLSGAAVDGRFYAKSWFRLGKTFQWAWQNGQPWLPAVERGEDLIGGFSGFQVDWNRGRLYEMTVNGLQVLDMETMAVLQTAPAPLEGRIGGYDPVTDQLYFVGQEDGHLLPWSLQNLPPP